MQNPKGCEGLTEEQARALQLQYGKNVLHIEKKPRFFKKVLRIFSEPMFLLLIAAAIIYFILGEPRDGAVMLVFVIGIISIEIIQSQKTDRTLSALKDFAAPEVKVLRDGKEKLIAAADIVPGDLIYIYEGQKVQADGYLLGCSDLCIDESSLTGESEGVWKSCGEDNAEGGGALRRDYCYAGTLVTHGFGAVCVEKIGMQTEYGRISQSVAAAPAEQTPLKRQIGKLVKTSAGIAAVLFALMSAVTYINVHELAFKERFVQSVLSGITLTMAMIPEELPVILTVFLSMGAWRLAKSNALVRDLPAVETLGSVSVLCVDKTGTITQNRMSVEVLWPKDCSKDRLIQIMGYACEINTYDPMEKAMLAFCEQSGLSRELLFEGELLHEYPFTNETKMMGHVWKKDDNTVIAAKGSPEQLLALCSMEDAARKAAEEKALELSGQGYRVIAVAESVLSPDEGIPSELEMATLRFCGLAGLADPPRKGVERDIAACKKAGIRTVMITGDNGETALAIASKIGMEHENEAITGEMLDGMSSEELSQAVRHTSVFARVVPEHKMRIVKAFKANGDVVAMTGDGVNDAPALKYADIGIAMGKRGSEVAREAADLILMDDDFSTIVRTVKDGRRIYDNVRKAVGYVITIHIPIALSSLLAPLLGINPGALMLLPLHVVLLELLIDPTCSIVFERQPAERDIMARKPRKSDEKLLDFRLFRKSALLGLLIFVASFGSYIFTLSNTQNPALARSMGLSVLIFSNLFVVFSTASDRDFILSSAMAMRHDKVLWFVNGLTLFLLGLILYSPLNSFFKLAPLPILYLGAAFFLSALSVLWYEIAKLKRRQRDRRRGAGF